MEALDKEIKIKIDNEIKSEREKQLFQKNSKDEINSKIEEEGSNEQQDKGKKSEKIYERSRKKSESKFRQTNTKEIIAEILDMGRLEFLKTHRKRETQLSREINARKLTAKVVYGMKPQQTAPAQFTRATKVSPLKSGIENSIVNAKMNPSQTLPIIQVNNIEKKAEKNQKARREGNN